MILENTIIENTKGCFMGKMILDDLRKRLERLDEDADLMIDNNDRSDGDCGRQCVYFAGQVDPRYS